MQIQYTVYKFESKEMLKQTHKYRKQAGFLVKLFGKKLTFFGFLINRMNKTPSNWFSNLRRYSQKMSLRSPVLR